MLLQLSGTGDGWCDLTPFTGCRGDGEACGYGARSWWGTSYSGKFRVFNTMTASGGNKHSYHVNKCETPIGFPTGVVITPEQRLYIMVVSTLTEPA